MRIYLLRHGETQYNAERRYQGRSDVPLSEEGRKKIKPTGFTPDCVWVSPMTRARQTADILFPNSPQYCVEDFREMNFGIFEGKNYLDMREDALYRAWVDSGCLERCPDGECKQEFAQRTCRAFDKLLTRQFALGQTQTVIVAHGGTQMAIMEQFAVPHRDYFEWTAPNAGGFLLDTQQQEWMGHRTVRLIETVAYTRGTDE